jgi:hypothetical protein
MIPKSQPPDGLQVPVGDELAEAAAMPHVTSAAMAIRKSKLALSHSRAWRGNRQSGCSPTMQ